MYQTIWQLHSVSVLGTSHNSALFRQWQRSFASLPAARESELDLQLELAQSLPAPPEGPPDFSQDKLLAYYVQGEHDFLVHLPHYGQLAIDASSGSTVGQILPTALRAYGVLEDLVAVSLSPHLRRRGYYLVHAFAAAWQGQAVLLVGDLGAGKTTSGMSLLARGWKLLSNDSPLVDASGIVYQYPGLLAAYPDTFARFSSTASLAEHHDPEQKISVLAEEIWADVWQRRAPIRAICFPRIEDRPHHALTQLSASETLRRLMPHTMEKWDRALMPTHLAALSQIVARVPGYLLQLGPDVLTLPDLMFQLLKAPDTSREPAS